MVIKLYNQSEELIQHIDATSVLREREVQSKDILSFKTTFKGIEKRHRVVLKDKKGRWQEYIVQSIMETRSGMSAICEHAFYETYGDYVEDKRPANAPAQAALMSSMETTRWDVLPSDDLGLKSTNFYRISAREAAAKVCEVWGGELDFWVEILNEKIIRRCVRILKAIGNDYGKRFEYGKDLIGVTRTIEDDDVITALHGFGKGEQIDSGGFGRRRDFASINNGKTYLENINAKKKYGRVGSGGGRENYYGVVFFDDCEDIYELKRLTQIALDKRSTPRISYNADVILLVTPGESVSIGDQVAVIDDEIGRVKARVLKLYEYMDGSSTDRVELGNYIDPKIIKDAKQQELINQVREKMGIWDSVRLPESIPGSIISGLLEEWNIKMNLGVTNAITTAFPGGFLFESEDWAMQIGVMGFRIANGKNTDGTWNFVTIGTGKGFVAEQMFAHTFLAELAQLGYVLADHVQLSDGTNLTQLAAGQLAISESLQHGGINLIRNPTFGGLKTPSIANWVSGYTMQLLFGRFDEKTISEMLGTMNAKTMGDVMNNAY